MVSINIDELSNDEHLDLISELWESLRKRAENDPAVVPILDSQKRELDIRMAAFRNGEMPSKKIDAAFDDIRSKRSKP